MDNCIFCKIAHGEISSETLYEDEKIKAFKDIKPSAPVHYLIIPKEHIQSLHDVQESHKEIIIALIFTAKRLALDIGLQGYRLVINVGRDGGQIIDHLHLHLLGGWNGERDHDMLSPQELDK